MIIANWKMNGSKDLIKDWITSVSENIKIQDEKECVFCPPVGYLNLSIELIKEKELGIKLGSQLIESNLSQPLTGGVSPEMLVDLGCEYAIIGHSEQRTYYNENDSQLINKIEAAIEENIKPIYCIGENSEQKKNGTKQEVLMKQLDLIKSSYLSHLVVAYEPIWAIGTGENAEVSHINETHAFIKEYIKTISNTANEIPVVYGGSVNLNNYKEIYSSELVNGLLIGGASLEPINFSIIYNQS